MLKIGSATSRIPTRVLLITVMGGASIFALRLSLADRQDPIQSPRTQGSLSVNVHSDNGGVSSYRALTVDQKLDRALSLPGIRGLGQGRVGAPVSHVLQTSSGPAVTVTDYPMIVVDWLGPTPAPYSVGATITLRIPGGTVGNLRMTVDGAPIVQSGEEVFVFVRNQGTIAGGSGPTTLVASDGTDVFQMVSGRVKGQGRYKGLVESLSSFKRHFLH